jgi:DMSO/TMAO reductase YedYZ molybdopterin-dependent catalytic subunit
MNRLGIAAALVLASVAAAEPPALTLTGDVPKPLSLSVADLEGLGPVSVTWQDHGRARQVYGVPLDKLLARAGFSPGAMGKDVPKREKRAGWKKVLRATAVDGFQAVFSCAELWEGMGPTRALVVWKIDGKPLPPGTGPFRLVVLTDQEPSRSVFAVDKLEVLDLRN